MRISRRLIACLESDFVHDIAVRLIVNRREAIHDRSPAGFLVLCQFFLSSHFVVCISTTRGAEEYLPIVGILNGGSNI